MERTFFDWKIKDEFGGKNRIFEKEKNQMTKMKKNKRQIRKK